MKSLETQAVPERWGRGFWALMFTQAQGAFSDNALKQLVIYLVLALHLGKQEEMALSAKAGAAFALPFILFSMFGGWLADRCSKRSVMRWVKTAEIGIMLFAAWALASGRLGMQMGAICLMGVHSAIFGPAKYGILPEVLPVAKLSWGNGILELLTFLGIIGGIYAAGELAERFGPGSAGPGWFLVAVAFAGWLSSLFITRVPAADPGKPLRLNFVAELSRQLRSMGKDRDLMRANWGNAAFWFVAALVGLNLPIFAEHSFGFSPRQISYLSMALSVGIALGSFAAGYLSRGKIEYGLIPLGALVMAVSGLVAGWPGIGVAPFAVALGMLGLGGGMFIVPVAAVLQHRPGAAEKGAVQGAANLVSWIGILLSSGVQAVFGALHRPSSEVFWFCGLAALVAGLYVNATRPGAVREFLRLPGRS